LTPIYDGSGYRVRLRSGSIRTAIDYCVTSQLRILGEAQPIGLNVSPCSSTRPRPPRPYVDFASNAGRLMRDSVVHRRPLHGRHALLVVQGYPI